MATVNSFYGSILALVVVVAALSILVSPELGKRILHRALISLVFFLASGALLPGNNAGLLLGIVRLLLSFIAFGCSVLYLINPDAVADVLQHVAGPVAISLLLAAAVSALAASTGGTRILISGLVIGALCIRFFRHDTE